MFSGDAQELEEESDSKKSEKDEDGNTITSLPDSSTQVGRLK